MRFNVVVEQKKPGYSYADEMRFHFDNAGEVAAFIPTIVNHADDDVAFRVSIDKEEEDGQ